MMNTKTTPAVAMAFVLMAGFWACERRPTDAEVADEVKAKLAAEPDLKDADLKVDVKEGKVKVTGTAPDRDAPLKVEKALELVPGATAVIAEVKLPEPVPFEVPAGTVLSVKVGETIDSATAKVGDQFGGAVETPITVEGREVVATGTQVTFKLVQVEQAGRMKGRSQLQVDLVEMHVAGQVYPLVASEYSVAGKSRGKETATRVGIGAGVGAVIGGIAGGGKGAAIGAAVGGGGATAYQAATKGDRVQVPAGTSIRFELKQPVTVLLAPAGR